MLESIQESFLRSLQSHHLTEDSHTSSLVREHGYEPMTVEGTLPADLRGTLLRNGPGLAGMFGRLYSHSFEGDGAITSVSFRDGEAFGAVRLVQSAGLLEEKARQKMIYSTTVPWPVRFWNGLRRKMKNTANTNVIEWQGRYFALMEAGLPTEILPKDLSTLGETNFDGLITQSFSAHPHVVSGRNAMYNFGCVYGRHSSIELFELPFQGKPRRLVTIPMERPPFLHDFVATENHLVFFLSPTSIDIFRALLALGDFSELIKWQPEFGTQILIVPIDRPQEYVQFQVDPFFQWHFSNAFEKDGEIVVDVVRYEDFGIFERLGAGQDDNKLISNPDEEGQFTRAFISPEKKSIRFEKLWDEPCEFPRIHPDVCGEDYEFAWLMGGVKPVDGKLLPAHISKLNVRERTAETSYFEEGEHTSEAIFVPRSNPHSEDDGYVLSLVYQQATHRSYIAVFDGLHLAQGPVARVWFDHHIPRTFHGSWVSDVFV